MFKVMGKEINAILGAQTLLIWTYVGYPLKVKLVKLLFCLDSTENLS